jgi:hypothetical protein
VLLQHADDLLFAESGSSSLPGLLEADARRSTNLSLDGQPVISGRSGRSWRPESFVFTLITDAQPSPFYKAQFCPTRVPGARNPPVSDRFLMAVSPTKIPIDTAVK